MRLRDSIFLATVLAACLGCGPQATLERLQVRSDYTAVAVVEAFDLRYALPGMPGKPSATVQETGATYGTIAEAVLAAPDGGTVLLGEGVFRESIVINGRKGLSLRGAGRNRTLVVSPETALSVSQSDVSIGGIGLWSTSVGAYVSVVTVSDGTATFSDCRLSGGTGAGILVTGKASRITLVGNLIVGNMGGGLRLRGGRLESIRNVITHNAVGGVILSPTGRGAIGALSFWHDTILENWAGAKALSFSPASSAADKYTGDCRIDACVLDADGMEEALSSEVLAQVMRHDNLLSPKVPAGKSFFRSPGQEDFAPAIPVPRDDLGLEFGAWPAVMGPAELMGVQAKALAEGKLLMAYMFSLFLPYPERERAGEQVKALLYQWVDDYLKDQRLGSRMVQALGLARLSPPEWRIEVVLAPLLEGCAARYSYALKPLNFFGERFGLADTVTKFLMARTSLFPRFMVATESGAQNAYVMGGQIRSTIMAAETSERFSVPATLDNPYRNKVLAEIKILESKLDSVDRKIADLDCTLSNPAAVAGKSKHRAGLEGKMEKLRLERGNVEIKLDEMRRKAEVANATFDIVVAGVFRRVEVKGELSVQFIAAPSGVILLDEIVSLTLPFNEATVSPNPEFGFAGMTLSGPRADPMKEAGNRVAEMMLEAVIAKEAATLRQLLDRFDADALTVDEEDLLAELLLMNARLYEAALGVKDEYDRLLAVKASPKPPIEVVASYDERKGQDRNGVVLDVIWNDQVQDARRINQIERIYKPYWELQEPLERYLARRFGLSPRLFFETRETLDRMLSSVPSSSRGNPARPPQ